MSLWQPPAVVLSVATRLLSTAPAVTAADFVTFPENISCVWSPMVDDVMGFKMALCLRVSSVAASRIDSAMWRCIVYKQKPTVCEVDDHSLIYIEVIRRINDIRCRLRFVTIGLDRHWLLGARRVRLSVTWCSLDISSPR